VKIRWGHNQTLLELPPGERSAVPPEDELLAVVTEALAESPVADADES
jgi:hypothetical protein